MWDDPWYLFEYSWKDLMHLCSFSKHRHAQEVSNYQVSLALCPWKSDKLLCVCVCVSSRAVRVPQDKTKVLCAHNKYWIPSLGAVWWAWHPQSVPRWTSESRRLCQNVRRPCVSEREDGGINMPLHEQEYNVENGELCVCVCACAPLSGCVCVCARVCVWHTCRPLLCSPRSLALLFALIGQCQYQRALFYSPCSPALRLPSWVQRSLSLLCLLRPGAIRPGLSLLFL